MKNKKILFTICARKGSKRLPGKSIKIFHGKPLIAWTINQIEQFRNKYKFKDFDADIVICTDINESLFTEYLDFGLRMFIKRPENLNGDDVPKLKVIRYIYNFLKDRNFNYNLIIDLDVTNPCRTIDDIENCINTFNRYNPSTLFSVVNARKLPYFNQIDIDYRNIIQYEKHNIFNREWLELKTYDLNASIYLYSINFIGGNNNSPICNDSITYKMPEWTAYDIDTQTDWDIAEMLFKKHILDKGK